MDGGKKRKSASRKRPGSTGSASSLPGTSSASGTPDSQPSPPHTSPDREEILRKKREQKDLSKLDRAKQVSVQIIRLPGGAKQRPKPQDDSQSSKGNTPPTNKESLTNQVSDAASVSLNKKDSTDLPACRMEVVDEDNFDKNENNPTKGETSLNDSGIELELPKELEERTMLSQTELNEIKNIEEVLMNDSDRQLETKTDEGDEDSLEDLPEISQQTVDEIVKMLPGHDDPISPPRTTLAPADVRHRSDFTSSVLPPTMDSSHSDTDTSGKSNSQDIPTSEASLLNEEENKASDTKDDNLSSVVNAPSEENTSDICQKSTDSETKMNIDCQPAISNDVTQPVARKSDSNHTSHPST